MKARLYINSAGDTVLEAALGNRLHRAVYPRGAQVSLLQLGKRDRDNLVRQHLWQTLMSTIEFNLKGVLDDQTTSTANH